MEKVGLDSLALASVFLTSLSLYLAISFDYLILLVLFFSQEERKDYPQIWLGYYLAISFSSLACLLIAQGLSLLIENQALLGLLGLAPLYLGLRDLFSKETESTSQDLDLEIEGGSPSRSIWLEVFLVILSSSSDDYPVFVPHFVSIQGLDILWTLLTFAASTAGLLALSQYLGSRPFVTRSLEKVGNWLIPLVLIIIGLKVLYENQTLHFLWTLLQG